MRIDGEARFTDHDGDSIHLPPGSTAGFEFYTTDEHVSHMGISYVGGIGGIFLKKGRDEWELEWQVEFGVEHKTQAIFHEFWNNNGEKESQSKHEEYRRYGIAIDKRRREPGSNGEIVLGDITLIEPS